MEGQPAWMASVTLRGTRGIVNTGQYTMEQMMRAKSALNEALKGVGDRERERLFRTNACLFLHRCTTPEEQGRLPAGHSRFPAAMPIQVLYTRGLPPIPSTDPCKEPRRRVLLSGRPDLWIPEGCGECVPCQARERLWEDQT